MAMAAVTDALDIIVNLVTTVPVSKPVVGEVQVAHLPQHHALDCSESFANSRVS
jgi:hypothetical protein